MTGSQAIALIELIQDKYESPYFLEEQALSFLNLSLKELAKEAVAGTSPLLGESFGQDSRFPEREIDKAVKEQVREYLISAPLVLSANDNNVIPYSAINGLLPEGRKVMAPYRVKTVSDAEMLYVPFVHGRIKGNSFLAPTLANPMYAVRDEVIIPYPAMDIKAELYQWPAVATLEGEIDIADGAEGELIGLTLRYMGISLTESEIKEIKA